MPVITPSPPAPPDDKGRLVWIMQVLDDKLSAMMGDDPTLSDLFDVTFKERARAAYAAQIKQEIQTVITAINSGEHEAALAEHGLTGPGLNFKIYVVEKLLGDLAAILGGPVGRALKKLLDALDAVLESILAAIGVKSAIAEFKACFEVMLD